MLSRGRCFPAASRIRPLVRAFCDAPPSLQDAASGVPSSQDHTEKVDDVKARPNELDIAIVGGGMVGLAVACALSNMPLTKHLRVGIIDSNPALKSRNYLKKDVVPDSRVSTITPATISFFRDIDAWDHVQQQRHAFFGKMQVWDYTGLGYTRYSARDVGKEYLGCVVENKVLCNSLLLRLQEENGDIEKMIYPTRLISLALPSKSRQAPTSEAISSGYPPEELNHSNLVKLELSDGQTLYSKLVKKVLVSICACAMLARSYQGRRNRDLGSPVDACGIKWTAAASLPLPHLFVLVFCVAVDHAWSIRIPFGLSLYY